MGSDTDEGEDFSLFQEPSDFYQPEKQATFATHKLLSGKEIEVRLVGHNPLWVNAPPFLPDVIGESTCLYLSLDLFG